MENLIREFGAEGTLSKLLEELQAMTELLPADTVTESGDQMLDRLEPLIYAAMSVAHDWDREVRRNGLPVGRF
jgi:hypothetical protein